jgi:CRP-like cAMP-binding protein
MPESKLQLLQNMPIFGGLTEDTLKFLLDIAPLISVPKGHYFFHQGDEAVSMLVLESGRVAILKAWKGQDYLLRYLERGDCFGEMALMDFFPRSASALAVEDCTAIEISSQTLYELYEKDLEQFAIIQMNMGREVSRRLREADEQLFEANVEARVINKAAIFRSL